MTEKIVQIIPADGWRAVFAARAGAEDWKAEASPLTCWALTDGGEILGALYSGTGGALVPAPSHPGFLGYLEPDRLRTVGQMDSAWQTKARAYGKALE